jgi:hypothetical protein
VKNHPLGLKTFYIVLDRFTAPEGESHRYDVHWQLEDVPVELEQQGGITTLMAAYGDGISLTMLSDGALTLRRGCESPFMGWRTPGTPSPFAKSAPHYDSVNRTARLPGIPAPSVTFSRSGETSSVLTILYPSDGGCPITSFAYENGHLTVYAGEEAWETELL